MQLGTRWSVGADTPARLPEAVVIAIRAVEADLVGVDTSAWRWTLTFLEGRPVVELDDGTTIRIDDRTGAASISSPTEDEVDD